LELILTSDNSLRFLRQPKKSKPLTPAARDWSIDFTRLGVLYNVIQQHVPYQRHSRHGLTVAFGLTLTQSGPRVLAPNSGSIYEPRHRTSSIHGTDNGGDNAGPFCQTAI
jgi:hypothetical protein